MSNSSASSSSSSSINTTTNKGKGKRKADTPQPLPFVNRRKVSTESAEATEAKAAEVAPRPPSVPSASVSASASALPISVLVPGDGIPPIMNRYELSVRCLVQDCGCRAVGPHYCERHKNQCVVPMCPHRAIPAVCFWTSEKRDPSLFHLFRRCSSKMPPSPDMCHCQLIPLCPSHQRFELQTILLNREVFPTDSSLIRNLYTKLAIRLSYAIFDVIDEVIRNSD